MRLADSNFANLFLCFIITLIAFCCQIVFVNSNKVYDDDHNDGDRGAEA